MTITEEYNESVPVRRRADIGRIRDCGTYLSPDRKQGGDANYLGGITEILDLEPLQGLWSVEQYLKLSNQTNHLIEFTDGDIEVLPMPAHDHQVILAFLYEVLLLLLRPREGRPSLLHFVSVPEVFDAK